MGENIRKEKNNNNPEAENRGKKIEELGEDNLKNFLGPFLNRSRRPYAPLRGRGQ